MSQRDKLLIKILLGTADANVPFEPPCQLLRTLGFMRMKIRYELIIYWSEDDQAFIAEVPELVGCAADGATYQEAVQNVEVVIQDWMETAKELGRPIPEPKGRLIFA